MVIFSGFGFLALVVPILVMIIFVNIFEIIGITNPIPTSIVLMFAGIGLTYMGYTLNQPNSFKFMHSFIDENGKKQYLFGGHTMFFIKLEYWRIAITGLGLFGIFYNL